MNQRINFANGKIYKITNSTDTQYYIGSTCETLSNRFNRHKSKYKTYYHNGSVFKLFDKYGIENCKIELIENYPCDNKKQLHSREGQIIKQYFDKCVNKKIPKIIN